MAGLVKLGEALRGIEYCGDYYQGLMYLDDVSRCRKYGYRCYFCRIDHAPIQCIMVIDGTYLVSEYYGG